MKDLTQRIRKRTPESHKGDYGHVFVVAGSSGLTGAAYLVSMGALLSGSGLVTLGIPRSLNPIMEIKLTEVMTLALAETHQQTLSIQALPQIKKFAEGVDVVAIGPGLSKNKGTRLAVRNLIPILEKPIVLDADGVNAFENKPELLLRAKQTLVITPHPGELSRLIGRDIASIQNDREGIAKSVSKSYKCITVLKGHRTVVATPAGDIYVNDTGNPGMATGGVGDILTGMIASFIGQGIEPFGAAKLAVYLHGKAGDLAKEEKGEISLIATDILHKLPMVFKQL